jgi:DNA invertase Pin-like site-specific DNA recombinase
MSAHRGKFIAYFRVSTDRQGRSGLGLEAQREAVLAYLNGGSWTMVAEFTEVESGKYADRPQLAAALSACKKHRAKLVIAKLDRLSRNLAFIATLMDSGVEFVAVDNPHANKLTVHILAAVAQHEREAIAQRTKDALQAAKARGKRLGNPHLDSARQRAFLANSEAADRFAVTEKRRAIASRRGACADGAWDQDGPRRRMDCRAGQRHSGARSIARPAANVWGREKPRPCRQGGA